MTTLDDLSVNELNALRQIPDELTPQSDTGVSWPIIESLLHKDVVGISSGKGGSVWRLPEGRALVNSATVAGQPDGAGDEVAGMRESLEVINKMTNPQVVQMNIDWINQVMSDSPIATALVLGDLLELFENVATKLQANQGATEGE